MKKSVLAAICFGYAAGLSILLIGIGYSFTPLLLLGAIIVLAIAAYTIVAVWSD